ncbi:putative Rmd1/YagE family protein [Winogradskyella eximia]|uniref:Putative Rmd1/YagE family protein n=1 Tax=Winogradskyella eximia TaxID=262006 RepID=A0A3D9HCU4_9FLAO|nr:RMD1 family protein [Winogradskyella eximia]RED46826.1 putative Rmd1/YagE family protein [Winogradskyella eximia]|tara:strand:+ start:1005 stop:1781 length:777 start_codon:yes stop_codon:yes gene_type:complete
MFPVVAYQIANTINIKASKQQLQWQLLFQDSDELFYSSSDNKYIYLFHYGIISFFNMSNVEIDDALALIQPFCDNYLSEKITEELSVVIQPNTLEVNFESTVLPELNSEMIRLVMLNTTQSVALDRYSEITQALISETNEHTKYLEINGRLNISGNKLKRFIGKILNIKNKISENLYIFDSPDSTWEDEQLNKLNVELKKTFDLKDRYHLIHNRIEIIKENLELFKDILDHRESSRLEWIIIILILVEVVDMFILKLF